MQFGGRNHHTAQSRTFALARQAIARPDLCGDFCQYLISVFGGDRGLQSGRLGYFPICLPCLLHHD